MFPIGLRNNAHHFPPYHIGKPLKASVVRGLSFLLITSSLCTLHFSLLPPSRHHAAGAFFVIASYRRWRGNLPHSSLRRAKPCGNLKDYFVTSFLVMTGNSRQYHCFWLSSQKLFRTSSLFTLTYYFILCPHFTGLLSIFQRYHRLKSG